MSLSLSFSLSLAPFLPPFPPPFLSVSLREISYYVYIIMYIYLCMCYKVGFMNGPFSQTYFSHHLLLFLLFCNSLFVSLIHIFLYLMYLCGKAQRAGAGFEHQTPMLQVMHANYLASGISPWPSRHSDRTTSSHTEYSFFKTQQLHQNKFLVVWQ